MILAGLIWIRNTWEILSNNIYSPVQILRCAANDDIITVKAQDQADTVTFMFESPNQEKVEFSLFSNQSVHR